jgi:hypothetical protein
MPLLRDLLQGKALQSRVLMSAVTGKSINDVEHLKLGIVDILITPLGSRVERRDYGSNLFRLLSNPINDLLIVRIRAATLQAINTWEPRLRLTQITVDASDFQNGHLVFDLEGYYLLQNRAIRLPDLSLDFFKSSRYATPQQ